MVAPCPPPDHVAKEDEAGVTERIRVPWFRAVLDKAFVPRFKQLDLSAFVADKVSLLYRD